MRGALALVMALATSASADLVERRGAAPALVGEVGRVDDSGLEVRSEFGATHFVPWDRVRRVVTDLPRPGLDRRASLAEDLWRARSRAERRDMTLAEPLFERLAERYVGKTHETALVVAEGLLRCRLARQAHAEALVPALEVIRLRRAGIETESYADLPPVFDEQTSLCPSLPPVWTNDRALARLVRALEAYDAQRDEVVEAIAALYREAARRTGGEADDTSERVWPDGPGIELLRQMIDTMSDDEDSRGAARTRLQRGLTDGEPSWREAWTRFAIGGSLALEEDAMLRHRGLVSLAHLPARFGRTEPYLAGLALALMVNALEQEGDSEGAAVLRSELVRRYPAHPARRTLNRARSEERS